MDDQSLLASFFALSFFVIFLTFIWIIVAYFLTAIALYTMAKNDRIDDAVFAFIPFLNMKVWGDLAKGKLPDFLKENAGWKVFGIYIVCFFLNFIPVIGWLASVVTVVLAIYLMYAILERYGTNAVLFTILHVITLSVFLPIHLFVIRKEVARY